MTTPEVCSPEAFENFFLAKCYDVISNGQYKKHLVRCKDTGETWAVKMGADVQLVQSCINKVQSAVASMPHMGNHLQEICRSVMNSAQPPGQAVPRRMQLHHHQRRVHPVAGPVQDRPQ